MHMEATAKALIAKIKAAVESRVLQPALRPGVKNPPQKLSPAQPTAPESLVAIGISTGGPQALEFLLTQLPSDFPASLVIVQHMPEGFTEMFARRLDELSPLRVKEAQSGDALHAGRVLICPGNRHIKVKRRAAFGDVAILSEEAPVNGHRPSVDVLFRSVAEAFNRQAIAVLMTGMGEDGAEGLGAVQKSGGITIAQSEPSCVVYGMPKAAIERGYATRIVSLEGLSATLQALCGRGDRNPGGEPDKAWRATP
jgi:two-component system chemotaxis response regulator CheB